MLRANALLGVEGRKGAAWDVEAGYEDFEGTSRRAWASEKGLRVCGMEGEPRRKFRLFFAAPLPLLSGPESVRDLCLRSCFGNGGGAVGSGIELIVQWLSEVITNR
eukprot:1142916-Pelagomonas_calceolata.AAC.3